MDIKLKRFNLLDFFRFLGLTLNKQYSKELEDNFFTYLFNGAKYFFDKRHLHKFVILADEKFAGSIGLWYSKKRDWEVGYFVLKKYRNKGVATEALQKILKFGFDKLNFKRVIASTDIGNKSSQKVLKKSGFRKIGEDKKENEFLWEKKL